MVFLSEDKQGEALPAGFGALAMVRYHANVKLWTMCLRLGRADKRFHALGAARKILYC